jgi:hypothetical protein
MGKWVCEDDAGRVVSFAETGPGVFIREFVDLPEVLKKPFGQVDVSKLSVALVDQVKAAPNEAAAELAAAAVILGEPVE